ncbi:MAG: pentapeptide repeat-containing protein [Dongiaceae bacterium]
MADAEQVALLRSGVSAWNDWRRQHSDITPDLSGAQLRGLDLSAANLSGADLRQADLRGANLRGAQLTRARLDEANFFKALLEAADLDGAVLLGAQFLNCAQLIVARNWANTARDPSLACGGAISVREG